MKRTYIIVSDLVDNLIKDDLPDADVLLFSTLAQLIEYTNTSPIRGTRMYLTKEVLEVGGLRNALEVLLNLLASPMCKIEEVAYITEKDSPEQETINYYLTEQKISNWTVYEGALNREFVTTVIIGKFKKEQNEGLHKREVYRVRKADYIKDRLQHTDILEEKYESEEERLGDIDEKVPVVKLPSFDYKRKCKVIYNVGLPCKERTIFSFLLAQYCAFDGKTLIIEPDFEFLLLSDMVARADNVKLFTIDIQDFYQDYNSVLREIRSCPEKLVVITANKRQEVDYDFVFQILYANLSEHLSYMIKENNITEMLDDMKYNIVMPNNTVDILKTIDNIPLAFSRESNFVGVDITSVSKLAITDGSVFNICIKNLLGLADKPNTSLVKITSFILGGETHDLRMYTS